MTSNVKSYFCRWNPHLDKVQLIFIDILNLLILLILICFHILLCSLVSLLDGLLLQPAHIR